MNEDHQCQRCQLCNVANSICLPDAGEEPDATLMAIFLDYPNYIEDRRGHSFVSNNGLFLRHLLSKMGIEIGVRICYTIKCYPGKIPSTRVERQKLIDACSIYRFATLQNLSQLQSIVVLGSLSIETFIGGAVGDRAGSEWRPLEREVRECVDHVWAGYSPGYALEKPAESGGIFRVIWKAAEEAGLQPKVTKVKAFDFDV